MLPVPPSTGTKPNLGTLVPHQRNPSIDDIVQSLTSSFWSLVRSAKELCDETAANATRTFDMLTKEQPPILSVIPEDLLGVIFGFINSSRDKNSFGSTCKTLCAISGAPLREHSLFFRPTFMEIGFLHKMQFNQKATTLCSTSSGIKKLPPEAIRSAEDDFYTTFKINCSFYRIDFASTNFFYFVNLVSERLSTTFKSTDGAQKEDLSTILNHFNEKIFLDIANIYASEWIKERTPNSFNKKIAQIQALFPMIDIVHVEAALRNAIGTSANREILNTLTNALLDPSSPEFKQLKETLTAELELSLDEIQHRIYELNGPNGSNGLINHAQHLMTTLIQGGFVLESERARKSYDGLCAELATLVVWTGANITGGKLHEIRTKLYHIDDEITHLSPFFAELCTEVLPDEEVARSEALHRIIS